MNLIELLKRLIDPSDPLKLFVQVGGIVGALITVLTTLTRVVPWLKAKYKSISIRNSSGAKAFTRQDIERALRNYISPMCQDVDPAGGEEPKSLYAVRQKLFDALDEALTHPAQSRYWILLADSGMGKTSALLNYYARHVRRLKKPFKLSVIPLGIADADRKIAEVEDKSETVLFLDALDEDTLAIIDHIERLRILLSSTRDFRRVLITCRTQFFSRDEEIPRETGIIKVGARAAGEPAEYHFKKIYLSPFSDRQVSKYINRCFPLLHRKSRRRAMEIVRKIPYLSVRPMLLTHIEDLVKQKREVEFSVELYEDMVGAWLEREEGIIRDKENLRQFSELLAVDLYLNRGTRGSERIPKSELTSLAQQWNIPLDDWKISGRSLLNRDAEGNFKFAHRSIMEYLFVRRYMQGDVRCLDVEWTDQMNIFLGEIFQKNISQKGVITFDHFLPKAEATASPEKRVELIRSLSLQLRQLEKLYWEKLPSQGYRNPVSKLKMVITLVAWFVDPTKSRNTRLTLFNVTNSNVLEITGDKVAYVLSLRSCLSFSEVAVEDDSFTVIGINASIDLKEAPLPTLKRGGYDELHCRAVSINIRDLPISLTHSALTNISLLIYRNNSPLFFLYIEGERPIQSLPMDFLKTAVLSLFSEAVYQPRRPPAELSSI